MFLMQEIDLCPHEIVSDDVTETVTNQSVVILTVSVVIINMYRNQIFILQSTSSTWQLQLQIDVVMFALFKFGKIVNLAEYKRLTVQVECLVSVCIFKVSLLEIQKA